jgi:hypothetical protein
MSKSFCPRASDWASAGIGFFRCEYTSRAITSSPPSRGTVPGGCAIVTCPGTSFTSFCMLVVQR